MRPLFILLVALFVPACSNSNTTPSDVGASGGSPANIAGAWTGSFASSNNPTEQITMSLTQTGGSVTGTWDASTLLWEGQVTGSVSAASFSGQITFRGTAFDNTICTGTANVSGTVSDSALSWTSTAGVVGVSCPAPLPAGIRLDLHR
jgi:hypothetical protein